MQAYRLLRRRGDQPTTVAHGLNGSRILPLDQWLEAEVKWTHNPGAKDQPHYWCGFHVFRDQWTALKYRYRFNVGNRPLIVTCEIEDTWAKPTNPDVILARWLQVTSQGWADAIRETEEIAA